MRNPVPVTFYRLGASPGHWPTVVPGSMSRGRGTLGAMLPIVPNEAEA